MKNLGNNWKSTTLIKDEAWQAERLLLQQSPIFLASGIIGVFHKQPRSHTYADKASLICPLVVWPGSPKAVAQYRSMAQRSHWTADMGRQVSSMYL